MAITYHHGNLLDSGADIIVNTVNCVGVMGKGLALQVAERWPECVKPYRVECSQERLKPGGIFTDVMYDGTVLVHMATKGHWRFPSQLEWVDSGLRELRTFARCFNASTSIAIGEPGCGNGKLVWSQVGPLVRAYLGDLDCSVMVYIGEGDREY